MFPASVDSGNVFVEASVVLASRYKAVSERSGVKRRGSVVPCLGAPKS